MSPSTLNAFKPSVLHWFGSTLHYTMLFIILPVFLLSSASLASAEVATDYWWSYPPDVNSSTGYNPDFEVCGTSCAECAEDAKRCHADAFSNICYEPAKQETCCNDYYGTACIEGFYCAYDNAEVAWCCENGTNIEDCGSLLEVELKTTARAAPTTIVVTSIFVPPPTASTDSRVSRPMRTQPPSLMGNSMSHNNGTTASSELSTGAIVGISVGVIGGMGAVIAIVVFFILRRRRNTKYIPVGSHPAPNATWVGQHTSPAAAHTAYEPFKSGVHSYDYQQPLITSAQPSVPATPYQDSAITHGPSYSGQHEAVAAPSHTPPVTLAAHELPEHIQ
ncbi:uncharacterized protein BDR25DRAFT_308013 [Lindgomyces ingoldianus]|uniref:Uncharacterized protein n=1 Tax=Lindgomyces ingoldianus TaxID=673940 RepID=A0ACB6Q829_9PLEO|nr:uncharacterized protein BDR25DRAFT_308013 [Lindgomyces ingoldianus]KAF2463016.1 hypothetical protein BDR25DRAFT_308013 [Lindgomyces ingoldianus]